MNKQPPYDVVVIGSGGAGLRAAIGAAEQGCKVMVLSKGKINRSGATLLAGANISADIACDGKSLSEIGIPNCNEDDSPEQWFADTIHEGFYLNNQSLVEVFVRDAPRRIEELMKWGMQVRGLEGERGISVFGSDILDSLFRACKAKGVAYAEDRMMVDIVVENGAVCGVVVLDILYGELEFYPARAVVLATGGAHNLYAINSGSSDLCGEGQAAALRAGASLIDMEFISFCPTVMIKPEAYLGNILPYIFQTLGYAKLINKYGNEFTSHYLSPRVENLALHTEWNKMLLSYVIELEIRAGRGALSGGIYQRLNREVVNIEQELYHDLPSLTKGIYVDLMKIIQRGEAFVISPAAHYFEGGIKLDQGMRTNIAGLFAAGECTGGMFGANRVSAATTEMLVEGEVAGRNAGKHARGTDLSHANIGQLEEIEAQATAPFHRPASSEDVESIKKDMQAITKESIWVIRNGKKLAEACASLVDLRNDCLPGVSLQNKERRYNREWIEYLQMRNMLLCASAVARSAQERNESRGVHIREDAPVTDNDNFLKNIVIENQNLDVICQPVEGHQYQPDWKCLDYFDGIEAVVSQLS
jgi:succinate dehydrogenase/fumarate reductase flavoprotein subunit